MMRSSASADSRMTLRAFRLLGVEAGLFEQFDHAEHAVHRRADFVAHHREEFGLRLGRAFGGVLGGLQIERAGTQFLEEPDVFDGDHRLIGKGGDQFDLLFGETPGRCSGRARSHRSVLPSRSSGTPSIERTSPISASSFSA